MFTDVLPLLQNFAAVCAKPMFFGLVPWYEYLTLASESPGGCAITNFNDQNAILGASSPFLLIALAILEDLVRVAGMVAVGYTMYGGFQYMTSQGAPDITKKAQQTIINALVGVAVAIIAAAAVAYLGHKLSE